MGRARWLLVLMVVVGMLTACTDTADPGVSPSTQPADSATPSGSWVPRAAAPIERTEVGAGVFRGQLWVLGGFAGSGDVSADVVSYDPATDAWQMGPMLPEPVHHTSVAGDGLRLWVVGGYLSSGFGRPTDAVRVLDAGGRWTDGPALPEPRAAGALAWDGNRLLYGGGVGPTGLSGDIFALEGDRWRRLGELSTAREHLAAASDGQGSTWFMAGRTGGLDTNLADVDLVADDRVDRIGAIPTPRGGVAGFHVPGRGGCVAGGEQPSGTLDRVECIGAGGSTTSLPSLGTARHGLGAVVIDGFAYVVLGGRSPGLAVSNVLEAMAIPPR